MRHAPPECRARRDQQRVDGRPAQEVVDVPGLRTGGEQRPHLLEVRGESGPVPGHVGGVEADQPGAGAVFGDVLVGLCVREPEPGAARDVEVGVDLGAVHPQEQFRLVDPVALTGVGVGDLEMTVDLPHASTGTLRVLSGPVRGRADETGRAHQPPPGVLAEVRVLHDTAHGPRKERLKVERTHTRNPHHGVRVHLPGHRSGPEKPGIAPPLFRPCAHHVAASPPHQRSRRDQRSPLGASAQRYR